MYDLIIYNAKIIPLNDTGIIENGYICIENGKITETAPGLPPSSASKKTLDAKGMVVMPSLVDCHTHLMEYATGEIHHTQGEAQKMAGIANLLTALQAGITLVGEHHLGHPVLSQTSAEYIELIKKLPIDVRIAFGTCFLGTNPLAVTSSHKPGQAVFKKDLTLEAYKEMAILSDYPGESIFLNATVANMPLSAAPRAGEITFEYEELTAVIDTFHKQGKKIGAHLEGDKAARMFIEAGGDVIHHGHLITEEIADMMAEQGISLVVTPHGGTSSRPTSPEEVYSFYRKGIKMALASDSYLPIHPEATWIDLPSGYLAGPTDFLKICQPTLKYFLAQGVSLEETLKLITVNGRNILELDEAKGTIQAGSLGDLIVCSSIPAVESTDINCIKYVIKNGQIIIAKS